MADSIEESLQDAIAELEAKELVKEVYYLSELDVNLVGNWVEKHLAILHKIQGNEGYTWSRKVVYIKDEAPYEYLWHYGGPQTDKLETPTYDFFLTKLPNIKQAKDFDFVEIEQVNEKSESVVIYAIKEKSNKYATIYRAKCWKTGETTWDYLIIETIEVEIITV